MRLLTSSFAALVVAASIGCSAANAGTFGYNNYTVLSPASVTLTDTPLGVSETGLAGQITLYPSSGTALSTFCFDIQHTLTQSGVFTTGAFLTGTIASSINALLSHVLPTLATESTASAALQVAIWKTEYGSNLTVTSQDTAVVSKADSYVANLASGAWKADATKTVAFLNGNGIDQSQIYLTAVPEPATLSILGLSLAGLLVLRHRISRKRVAALS
jgi:hypothetical protein